MKNRVLSGTVLVALMVAIVVFNSSFPMALNIAISLVSVLAVTEIITAIGMAKNYVLMVPSLLFSAALPLTQGDIWREGVYFPYTVFLFSALIRYHKSTTFREVGIVFSMALLIPTALDTIVGLRAVGGRHGMFYVIIAIFSAWIADTGAFFAGLMITKTTKTDYVTRRFNILSYILLSPIFFANIGIQVQLPKMSSTIIWFAVALTLVAILTKIVGCGFGAKLCRYKNKDCVRIGVGMISRGEVALIVASKGNAVGLMSPNLLGPVVIVVVLTTIVAPVFLKMAFSSGKTSGGSGEPEVRYESELMKNYNRQME